MLSINYLNNGLAVIVEEMPHLESVAYDLQIPGGIVFDAEDKLGASLIFAELTGRGAGEYSSREISQAYEDKGIRRSEGAGHDRFLFRGSMLSENLPEALRLLSLTVLKPILPESEISSIKSLLLQDIAALQDNPSRRVMLALNEKYYPAPHNRSSIGTQQGLESTTHQDVLSIWKKRCVPKGSVLSVAGKVKTAEVLKMVEAHFSDWQGDSETEPPYLEMPQHAAYHTHSDSAQLQIAFAFPSARFGDNDYYAAKVANGLLSGGMFGRLFIEVREKRGLCYSVFSRHASNKVMGTVTAYAGTTPERAHETLSVMLDVMRNVKAGLTTEELERSKANLKAALVMGEESSGSRAVSNAGDWWLIKKIRSLDEIKDAINRVTVDDVATHFERYAPKTFMLSTLGSVDLTEIYNKSI